MDDEDFDISVGNNIINNNNKYHSQPKLKHCKGIVNATIKNIFMMLNQLVFVALVPNLILKPIQIQRKNYY